MAARMCPHCNIKSNFTPRTRASGTWGAELNLFSVEYLVQTCQNCGGLLFVVYKSSEGEPPSLEEWSSYPATIPLVNKAVPLNVATDFVSGVNCLAISEAKAAATMFRRSLQQIMIDKGEVSGKLRDQIDALAKKNIITNDLKDWAHEIRLWGNEGAHPSSDGLENISMDECIAVKEFMESILNYVYTLPAKVATSRAARSQSKSQA